MFPSHPEQVFGKKAWPLVRIGHILFAAPGNLVLLQRESLGRAFHWMALVAILSGLAVGAGRLPHQLRTTRQWATWLGNQVNAVWLEDGRLRWERPPEAPPQTSFDHWRIDFVEEGVPFGRALGRSQQQRGLWFAPEGVYIWWYTADNQFTSARMIENGKLWGMLPLDAVFTDGDRLENTTFATVSRQWFWRGVPVLLLHEALLVFFQALLYALIFSALPLMLRSPVAPLGFRPLFTVMLFAAIPPLLIAGVYAGINVPLLSHRSIFLAGFLLYQFWAMRGFQRQIAAAAAIHDSRGPWPPK